MKNGSVADGFIPSRKGGSPSYRFLFQYALGATIFFWWYTSIELSQLAAAVDSIAL
jgi:hypothetical protein